MALKRLTDRQVMQRDVGFADDAFVEEEGTHGAGKQGVA